MRRQKKQSLTRLIFFRNAATILAVCVACVAVTLWFLYAAFLEESRQSLRDEAQYIAAGVELGQEGFLDRLSPRGNLRITWIGPEGDVRYDSQTDPDRMDNHADRPEIREALESGVGESSRESGTLAQWIIYRAVRIGDGSVVRLSLLELSALDMLRRVSVPLLILLLGAMVVAVVISAAISRKIVAPINAIELRAPNPDAVYAELLPLTQRITAQNEQIREQMRRQEEDHEAQDRFRREFTANVSHELKTPLTSISGFAEIIRDGLVRPEDISHFAGNIYKEAQRLIVLVGDIIKISRMDDRQMPLQKETLELYSLSEGILERLGPAAEKAGVKLRLSGAPGQILGNYQLVDEMVYNLCDNAIKYNRSGGSVEVAVRPEGEQIVLTVTDTGIGIPKEHQDRVFERFYRVDKNRSRQIGGTGLGLSIVKHGAIFHKAALSLDSTPGEGTTITISFPK